MIYIKTPKRTEADHKEKLKSKLQKVNQLRYDFHLILNE